MLRLPPADELDLALHEAGIEGYEREHRFAIVLNRKWRADFCFPAALLIVECEGAVWVRGRHVRGGGFTEDCAKYNAAVELGFRVLRYTTAMVRDGTALEQIRRVLGCRKLVVGALPRF